MADFKVTQLEADLSTIEGVYRRQGFSGVRVTYETELSSSNASGIPVGLLVTIAEQVQTLVGSVRIQGNTAIAESRLREGLGLEPGRVMRM